MIIGIRRHVYVRHVSMTEICETLIHWSKLNEQMIHSHIECVQFIWIEPRLLAFTKRFHNFVLMDIHYTECVEWYNDCNLVFFCYFQS